MMFLFPYNCGAEDGTRTVQYSTVLYRTVLRDALLTQCATIHSRPA